MVKINTAEAEISTFLQKINSIFLEGGVGVLTDWLTELESYGQLQLTVVSGYFSNK